MRNTGWYIPYWRKPARKKGKGEKGGSGNTNAGNAGNAEDLWRSDEQLDAVRQRWIERYRRTARALRTLGLSVGSGRAEVQARYDSLRAQGRATREVEDAYRHLQRALPPAERRKKRPQQAEAPDAHPQARASVSAFALRETTVTMDAGDGVIEVVAVDLYAGEGEDEVDPDSDPYDGEDDAGLEDDDVSPSPTADS